MQENLGAGLRGHERRERFHLGGSDSRALAAVHASMAGDAVPALRAGESTVHSSA